MPPFLCGEIAEEMEIQLVLPLTSVLIEHGSSTPTWPVFTEGAASASYPINNPKSALEQLYCDYEGVKPMQILLMPLSQLRMEDSTGLSTKLPKKVSIR